MSHTVTAVRPGSIAARHGIRPGDLLLSINGEEILDEIDYQALSTKARTDLLIVRDGQEKKVQLLKAKGSPLGITLDGMELVPRHCRNKCVFCFIDQMPKGMRETLYVKDDDWRMSLMMGNYITLTNVDDAEFARILKRRVSPLYISVHATDPGLRVKMMRNPNAALLLPRLNALREAGLSFHCQIVLCPGLNDGKALEDTLNTLASLHPAAKSAAIVPVGLTKHREGLYPLETVSRDKAKEVLSFARAFQQKCLDTLGTRFVYPSDEFYLTAGEDLPEDAEYEDYPQIENGVGSLRLFESSLKQTAAENTCPAAARRVMIACGTAVAPMMQKWVGQYAPEGVKVTVRAVENTFFGPSVTVTGLLTGGDLLRSLKDAGEYADELLLSSVTLRSEKDLFLDGMSLDELKKALPVPLTLTDNTAEGLYRALLGAGA